MTTEGPATEATTNVNLDVSPKYDKQFYWLILPLNGSGEPKVRKTDPFRLASGEFALRLQLNVPTRRTRIAQTIEVTLPDEFTHLAQISVAVADEGAG